jgi:ferredoxin like protein
VPPADPDDDETSATRLTVEDRLGLNTFEVDEEPFIVVDTELCKRCVPKPCLYVCPSQVYVWDGGELQYNPEGCIELGACTIVCDKIGEGAIRWNYPRGRYGVEFRFG